VERDKTKFITRQPQKEGKDEYDSENVWISGGLPSSRRRRRGEGAGEGGSEENNFSKCLAPN